VIVASHTLISPSGLAHSAIPLAGLGLTISGENPSLNMLSAVS